MLYIVGLGLGNEKDITLRGLEAVKKCDKIFIEAYTSLLSFGLSSDGLSTLVSTIFRPFLFYICLQFLIFLFLNKISLTGNLVRKTGDTCRQRNRGGKGRSNSQCSCSFSRGFSCSWGSFWVCHNLTFPFFNSISHIIVYLVPNDFVNFKDDFKFEVEFFLLIEVSSRICELYY